MSRLRWKLLLAMLSVVVLTIAVSGFSTRRVTHEELRRFELRTQPHPDVSRLAEYYRANGTWSGVERIIDTIPGRVVIARADGSIIAVSSALRSENVSVTGTMVKLSGRGLRMTFRLPPEEIGGARIFILPAPVASRDASKLDRRLVGSFAGGALAAILLALFVSSRITRPVERLTVAVDALARGAAPAHVEVSGHDEIARLASSFNAMSDALAQQQALRRRMVGDVAHELRTPLTNLRCELEAMQDGLTQPDPSHLASLHEEVLHLSRLVEDLQELALAESGGLVLHREPINLGEVVTRAASAFGGRVVVEARDVTVDADPVRIGQIVRNLVGNALRHARERVDVKVFRDGNGGVIAVADDGPGIPANEISRIFERFYRIDDARSRTDGGAGLGLSIVKQLVELHGGTVTAGNRPEGGAVFTVRIPG